VDRKASQDYPYRLGSDNGKPRIPAVIVIHASLLAALQEQPLDDGVTATVPVLKLELNRVLVGEMVLMQTPEPACVIVKVWPMVMVPVLAGPLFAATAYVTVVGPPGGALTDLIVIQASLLLILQEGQVPDLVTVTVPVPPEELNRALVGEMVKVQESVPIFT
jgi:hypothetical protein